MLLSRLIMWSSCVCLQPILIHLCLCIKNTKQIHGELSYGSFRELTELWQYCQHQITVPFRSIRQSHVTGLLVSEMSRRSRQLWPSAEIIWANLKISSDITLAKTRILKFSLEVRAKKRDVTAISSICWNQNFGRHVTGHGGCRIDRNGTVVQDLECLLLPMPFDNK